MEKAKSAPIALTHNLRFTIYESVIKA